MLLALNERPGKVFEHSVFLDHIWGRDLEVETRIADVHIPRLRKALIRFDADTMIRTIRNTGYA